MEKIETKLECDVCSHQIKEGGVFEWIEHFALSPNCHPRLKDNLNPSLIDRLIPYSDYYHMLSYRFEVEAQAHLTKSCSEKFFGGREFSKR